MVALADIQRLNKQFEDIDARAQKVIANAKRDQKVAYAKIAFSAVVGAVATAVTIRNLK